MGLAMLAAAAWFALIWWRRREALTNRWFLRAAALCGPAAVLALESGWVTTEVGRQPWVVYGILRTADAVNPAPGLTVGLGLVALSAWGAWAWSRRRDLPRSRWFLRAAALSGVGASLSLEAGWVVTEVGRQPWIVYGVLRTSEAVNPAPGLVWGFVLVSVVYAVLTVATVYVLRRLARDKPVPVAPQERDVTDYTVV